ncbi:hypothetical protein FR483_n198R [Paramecium bursaria Chlorella virus FR483]|uniref:Uncharacterized protein n198R n=1 Tax=Paramecium bursaria Chlorella virus FR483 TaxID=399781 RepID=A7J6Q2_PBCVF|nr:hypothetical protein FR483_n198R [Paramecium bursaria Chlorella virus FR483]ABT15483.1 hypothetical protein FR483_n198R [Paramecium bursaria Chlorella virus FR483]
MFLLTFSLPPTIRLQWVFVLSISPNPRILLLRSPTHFTPTLLVALLLLQLPLRSPWARVVATLMGFMPPEVSTVLLRTSCLDLWNMFRTC